MPFSLNVLSLRYCEIIDGYAVVQGLEVSKKERGKRGGFLGISRSYRVGDVLLHSDGAAGRERDSVAEIEARDGERDGECAWGYACEAEEPYSCVRSPVCLGFDSLFVEDACAACVGVACWISS